MDTDDGWPQVWVEMSNESYGTGSVTIFFSQRTVPLNMQNALRNLWPKPTSAGRLKWWMRRCSGS